MSVQPPSKTLPQDKDIVVSEPKITGSSQAREQLSVVLDNLDQHLQQEILERIQDVKDEEERALIAEAYLAKLIEEERLERLASSGGSSFTQRINEEATSRLNADNKIISAIQTDRSPLSISISPTVAKAVQIAKAWEQRIDPSTGSPSGRIVIPNGDSVSDFNGADINLATGSNSAGNSFTPTNFVGHENEYSRYLFILLPNNTIEVRPSGQFHTNPSFAPYPSLSTNGILIGSVVARDNGDGGVGTITDIDPLTITYFKDSMGTGAASAPVINTSPLEVQENEVFVFYTKADFQEDRDELVQSTSGANDVIGNGHIVLDSGELIITKDLVGSQARVDALYLDYAQAKILYKNDFVDNLPSVQFSRDGGLNWKDATISIPGTASSSFFDYKGNLIIADVSFANTDSTPIASSVPVSGTKAIGSSVCAIIEPQFNTLLNGFIFSIKTSSTAGTVVAKLYTVYAGTPQTTVLRTSAETLYAGQDIDGTSKEVYFSFRPIVIEKGTQYALVIEGSGLNATLEVDKTDSTELFNKSSSLKNGGGWLASGDKIFTKIFGCGYELVMKLTSSSANTKVAGFGVNYITDTAIMMKGNYSWEDRTITSQEASSGLISLNMVQYTPGVRQLHANIEGKEYFSPDFAEINSREVRFPSNFLVAGKIIRFYNTYGLVDSKSAILEKINAVDYYTRYVSPNGSDLNTGSVVSPFRTIKAAQINALATGGIYIKIGPGYFVEENDWQPSQGLIYEGCGINVTTIGKLAANGSILPKITWTLPSVPVSNGFTIFRELAANLEITRSQSSAVSGTSVIQMFQCNGSITYNGYNTSTDIVQLRGGLYAAISVRGVNFQLRESVSVSSIIADTVGANQTGTPTFVFLSPGFYVSGAVAISGNVRLSAFSGKIDGAFTFDAQNTNPTIYMDAAALAAGSVSFTNGATITGYIDQASNIGFSPAIAAIWPAGTNTIKKALDHLVLARNKAVSALNIDWADSESFYKDISAASTFTFSNVADGKTIIVTIKNTSASAVSITWPVGLLKDASYSGSIAAGKESMFTFFRSNGKMYLAEYKDLA